MQYHFMDMTQDWIKLYLRLLTVLEMNPMLLYVQLLPLGKSPILCVVNPTEQLVLDAPQNQAPVLTVQQGWWMAQPTMKDA